MDNVRPRDEDATSGGGPKGRLRARDRDAVTRTEQIAELQRRVYALIARIHRDGYQDRDADPGAR